MRVTVRFTGRGKNSSESSKTVVTYSESKHPKTACVIGCFRINTELERYVLARRRKAAGFRQTGIGCVGFGTSVWRIGGYIWIVRIHEPDPLTLNLYWQGSAL